MLGVVARASLNRIDQWCARARASASEQQPHLVAALFHVLHPTRDDPAANALAPTQHVTIDDFRRFIDAMLSAGYAVVSSEQLAQGCAHARKQLMLTFDDGYFNNTLALPVLEEFGVPATFFISTRHVLEGKSFWWDAAARAMHGKSRHEIDATLRRFKKKTGQEIEAELLAAGGSRALQPLSDADRPMRPSELRDFARSRWVVLGNHTADHTILTNCGEQEARSAIAEGRRQLQELTGVRADAIAFPNGAHSPDVVEAARSEGHRVGFTCVPKSNALPLGSSASMTLGRHLIWGGADYARQVSTLAAALLPGARLRSAIRELT